jgi:hypothetical protein
VGLFIRINAFRGVSHADVHAALAEFWSRHARQVQPVPPNTRLDAFELYEQRDSWTVLRWTSGWEWNLRRQAQLYVSQVLGCAGILVFVYDGDDWGYELFDRGAAVDWFIQWPQEGNTWFPGRDLSGSPRQLSPRSPTSRSTARTSPHTSCNVRATRKPTKRGMCRPARATGSAAATSARRWTSSVCSVSPSTSPGKAWDGQDRCGADSGSNRHQSTRAEGPRRTPKWRNRNGKGDC